MLTSDILRFTLTGLMATLVLTNSFHLWMIYVIALLSGTISSFFTPASSSFVPQMLDSEDIHFVLQDPALRLVYILIAAVNLIFVGPLLVGIPVLADTRLPQGAAAFGMIMPAYGGGNLAGILLAGALPRFKPQAVTLAVHPRSSGVQRVMSLVLSANLGLGPLSQALSGVLFKISINGLFIGAGILRMLIAGGMLLTPNLKIIGLRIAGVEPN